MPSLFLRQIAQAVREDLSACDGQGWEGELGKSLVPLKRKEALEVAEGASREVLRGCLKVASNQKRRLDCILNAVESHDKGVKWEMTRSD